MPRGMVVLGFVVILAFAASWASHHLARSESSVEQLTLMVEPERQAVRERTWRSAPSLVASIEDDRVFQPAISAIHGEQLYVLDWRDRSVKRLSLSGEVIAVARMESDDLLPEAQPSHFDVSPNGELYIAYRDLGAVRVFSADGTFLRSVSLPKTPHRVAALSDSEFVVMTGEPDRFLFHRFSVDGRLLSSFGRLVQGVQRPLPLDGWIASDGRGGIVFASFHSGMLARFDATDGSQKFLVEAVRRGPLPSVMVAPSGRRRVKPGSPFYSLAVNVDGDRIYVLSDKDRFYGRGALDVYDVSDGTYLWSTQPPEPMSHAFVRGGLLFGGSSKRLGVWRLPPSPLQPADPLSVGVAGEEGRKAPAIEGSLGSSS